ncbi:MAG: hypothetical protein M1819_003618 [Sarea resinae]|nr:MAG: hypothetical protein M1819_003618 [Sarea resinae]
MATPSCRRCLLHPPTRLPQQSAPLALALPLRSAASFSTTSASLAKPPAARANNPGAGARGTKALKLKKKAFVRNAGRPPAPGERKAIRKRIVLSNINALDVPGMQDLTPETMVNAELQGQVVGLPGPVVDQLRAVDAFKTTQSWGLFRKPGMLMRKESVELGKFIDGMAGNGKETMRRIFTGDRGTGKSIVLLQAMAMAFQKGWVVISIPEAQELTIAHTAYAPISGTGPTQYSQKTYTATLLSQISRANADVLSGLTLAHKHPKVPIPLQSNMSLQRLADLGARDPDIAWPIFQALWTELTVPAESASSTSTTTRPPVLLALDGLAHVMKHSLYRSADFSPIHAHDLALVRFFTSHLSGALTLPQGGAVLAATSESNTPSAPAMALALAQNEAIQASSTTASGPPQPNPFQPLDDRVLAALKDVPTTRLAGLSRDEARALMEYWALSGVLRRRVDEGLVAEKWTLAGHGVVGELEKGSVVMRV